MTLLSLLMLSAADTASAVSGVAICGNGSVEAGEECDPGGPLGASDCNTFCERIELEPAGLPFAPPIGGAGRSARIFSSELFCQPFGVRDGARSDAPARVRYRIHLCQTSNGTDSFTPAQVRSAMSLAAAEFARGGIVLEEESLVRFIDDDCGVPLDGVGWSAGRIANTPPGVLALTFVKAISNPNGQFGVGGFCNFFGPLCVNAAAIDSLIVHEIGHFFGLVHTFECGNGIETPATCADDGDMICDTPPDRGPAGRNGIAFCPNKVVLDGSCRGTCGDKLCTDGSTPDGYNWMSYYDCRPGRFSDEQRDFMRCTLDHELRYFNLDPPAPTTTTTVTSSTIVDVDCGDITEDGQVTTSDALALLRIGVGVGECPLWLCDYDGTGSVTATDALAVLRAAVGTGSDGKCPGRF